MNAEQLRALQAPIKAQYKSDPASAVKTMTVQGRLDGPGLTCTVDTKLGPGRAGLHPAAGGDGTDLCSGDMLLESLVACAGVTLRAVATAMEIPLRGGTITARGVMDFRGTLGVSKEAPVGFQSIELEFALDTDAPPEKIETLLKLTERYCVISQTLKSPPVQTWRWRR
jgi:uncharacterized OsmC-like protein